MTFPTARKSDIVASVAQILVAIEGHYPLRKDLNETPVRVLHALEEMLDGYDTDIDMIFKSFEGEGTDEIIIMRDIPFTSFCEHHLLPFSGVAHVAYLPNGKVIGASKMARLVCAYAHRLQIQERITQQVAQTMMDKLKPRGAAVILQAQHSCMICRGIKAFGSSMITSIMLGAFRDNQSTRMEVLGLLGMK
jgi:GTP cyclohydrolase I